MLLQIRQNPLGAFPVDGSEYGFQQLCILIAVEPECYSLFFRLASEMFLDFFNALPYPCRNQLRNKKAGVLTTRGSLLVSHHLVNLVMTRVFLTYGLI